MTGKRKKLIDPPDDGPRGSASGDLLSRVLAQIRLTGDDVRSCTLAQSEPLTLEAEAAHVLVVAEGALRIGSDEEEPAIIGTNDLVLLPRGPGASPLVSSRGPTVVIVCRFSFDPYTLRGMISGLPERIHIRHAEAAEWLDGMVHFMMRETVDPQPGAALMISRIIDLLVIRTLRTWVHRGHTSGWLGGLSDARIARALTVMHDRPARPWSIGELADVAGMSRSSFAERFTELVGRSPLRYQNEWRLGLARDMLARRGARVGEIGLRIGYESEAAFSRAYKALFGHSPRDRA
ncbi:AraC family transcriptional regulator [Methylobacterium nonmethylotrophicum]|uniref:AraC family transcriptional regulator n=1 Tax=Methylobacterium nonmethylotrophicum TaxID=1141884 RepID=A0A4Z0NR69_9HYPH|nr:AraC family transcriptional regulator [Methylobacterium nonmethylotrophicum]TGD99349.1 AraC family transcriptional regulator [Methylobacterium nonmethylotrophicum]